MILNAGKISSLSHIIHKSLLCGLKKMQEINLSSGSRKGSLQQGTKTTTLKKIYKFDYIKIKVLIDKMDEIYT